MDPLTGFPAARVGAYVHFPFCLSKCPYCDFASIAARAVPEERYTRAVLAELSLRGGVAGRLDSVFFGGGTPSLWDPSRVGEVLDALDRAVGLTPACEISLEANPGAADAHRFRGYRAAGVNRLSMGVQSFSTRTLAVLGRGHSGDEARAAFAAARAAGFDNVSLDFIYGVHGQTVAEVEADAAAAVALGPEHLSAYALTLDRESLAEEVPLARALRRGEVQLPADEVVVAMQRVVRDVYRDAGLFRYEISNYARAGYHSRHNALYWTQGEYLALGVGATGTVAEPGSLDRLRYANHRSAEGYFRLVESGQLPTVSAERLGPVERFEERLAMGLRLVSGVDLAALCAAFAQPLGPRGPVIDALAKAGLATWDGARLALTDAGMDVHSAIAARLMEWHPPLTASPPDPRR